MKGIISILLLVLVSACGGNSSGGDGKSGGINTSALSCNGISNCAVVILSSNANQLEYKVTLQNDTFATYQVKIHNATAGGSELTVSQITCGNNLCRSEINSGFVNSTTQSGNTTTITQTNFLSDFNASEYQVKIVKI